LQLEITKAAQRADSANPTLLKVASPRTAITTADFGRAVWQRYLAALEADDANRELYPSKAEIAAEMAKLELRAERGEISPEADMSNVNERCGC
jgi:hypothetical protein